MIASRLPNPCSSLLSALFLKDMESTTSRIVTPDLRRAEMSEPVNYSFREFPIIVVIVMIMASASCGGETTDGGEPPSLPDIDPSTDCDGRLDPVAPRGTVQVVGTGDAASCTEEALHNAVDALNDEGGGTITFDCGGDHTIVLTESVFIGEDAVVDGGSEITLSGGEEVRVIELDHHIDFVIQRITIADGYVPAGSDNESGAGVLHPWYGTLKVIDATFENNHSASRDNDVGGGAIYAGGLDDAVVSGSTFHGNRGSIGGGILSRSTNLRVIDTVFFENAAESWAESGQYGNGGGLYIDRLWLDDPVDFRICGAHFEANRAQVHGSAFFSYNLEGTGAVFDRCTFKDNDMEGSPSGGTGTIYHEGVPLLFANSTVSANTTGAHASGLFLGGGTNATVINSTFADNATPGNAGGLWAGNGDVDVVHSTFFANSADFAPAIFQGADGEVRLRANIFSHNTTDNEFSALSCHETFDDGGGNLQWPDVRENDNPDTPCAEQVEFADPQLEPLADNGGVTETMAINVDSPAAGLAGGDCPPYDQRGEPRSDQCAAGAYEP